MKPPRIAALMAAVIPLTACVNVVHEVEAKEDWKNEGHAKKHVVAHDFVTDGNLSALSESDKKKPDIEAKMRVERFTFNSVLKDNPDFIGMRLDLRGVSAPPEYAPLTRVLVRFGEPGADGRIIYKKSQGTLTLFYPSEDLPLLRSMLDEKRASLHAKYRLYKNTDGDDTEVVELLNWHVPHPW